MASFKKKKSPKHIQPNIEEIKKKSTQKEEITGKDMQDPVIE